MNTVPIFGRLVLYQSRPVYDDDDDDNNNNNIS